MLYLNNMSTHAPQPTKKLHEQYVQFLDATSARARAKLAETEHKEANPIDTTVTKLHEEFKDSVGLFSRLNDAILFSVSYRSPDIVSWFAMKSSVQHICRIKTTNFYPDNPADPDNPGKGISNIIAFKITNTPDSQDLDRFIANVNNPATLSLLKKLYWKSYNREMACQHGIGNQENQPRAHKL